MKKNIILILFFMFAGMSFAGELATKDVEANSYKYMTSTIIGKDGSSFIILLDKETGKTWRLGAEIINREKYPVKVGDIDGRKIIYKWIPIEEIK